MKERVINIIKDALTLDERGEEVPDALK